MQRVYRQATRVLSAAVLVLGLAMASVTVAGGGGPLARGVVGGVLLAALGAGRLVLSLNPPETVDVSGPEAEPGDDGRTSRW